MNEQLFAPDICIVEEVIICTKKFRGNGKDDPIRVITEVLRKDGKLIAEFDPIPPKQSAQ